MEQYLIDTNVISDYFTASFSSAGLNFLNAVMDASPNISIITQIELLCWNADAVIEQKVKNFIDDCNVVNITPDVIVQCVQVRKGKKN